MNKPLNLLNHKYEMFKTFFQAYKAYNLVNIQHDRFAEIYANHKIVVILFTIIFLLFSPFLANSTCVFNCQEKLSSDLTNDEKEDA